MCFQELETRGGVDEFRLCPKAGASRLLPVLHERGHDRQCREFVGIAVCNAHVHLGGARVAASGGLQVQDRPLVPRSPVLHRAQEDAANAP